MHLFVLSMAMNLMGGYHGFCPLAVVNELILKLKSLLFIFNSIR